MKYVTIEVYALRSKRNNAKAEKISFSCYPNNMENRRFTRKQKTDIQQWLMSKLESKYNYFQFIIKDGTFTLSNGKAIERIMHDFTPEPLNAMQAATLILDFMDLYNHALANNYIAI